MNNITDFAASPVVAVPTTIMVSAANILSFLPIFINIATAVYLTMLVGHKAWVWYREWKGKQAIVDKDELP
jgi:hypothetical protein